MHILWPILRELPRLVLVVAIPIFVEKTKEKGADNGGTDKSDDGQGQPEKTA